MRNQKARRFGMREVKAGPFKGSLHVAPAVYTRFLGELSLLHDYLNRRLLPADPEEVMMRGILVNLHNILEYEAEFLIHDGDHDRGVGCVSIVIQ